MGGHFWYVICRTNVCVSRTKQSQKGLVNERLSWLTGATVLIVVSYKFHRNSMRKKPDECSDHGKLYYISWSTCFVAYVDVLESPVWMNSTDGTTTGWIVLLMYIVLFNVSCRNTKLFVWITNHPLHQKTLHVLFCVADRHKNNRYGSLRISEHVYDWGS